MRSVSAPSLIIRHPIGQLARRLVPIAAWALVGCSSSGASDAPASAAPEASREAPKEADPPDATLPASEPDAGADAGIDAAAAKPDATCVGEPALAGMLDALQAAVEDAVAVGLVGEPALTGLLSKDRLIGVDVAKLDDACTVALEADLAQRIPALTTELRAWIATAPSGATSTPPAFIMVGQAYGYTPTLSVDAAGVSFALPTAPTGATIDAATGVITWQPAAAAKGVSDFVLEATKGATTFRQAFTVTVAERTLLATAPISATASVVTISGTGTALDGAVVRVPANLASGSDMLTLSLIDPAPPGPTAGVTIAGPALEVALASGPLTKSIGIELPITTLASGAAAALFAWNPRGGYGSEATANGAWAPTGTGATEGTGGAATVTGESSPDPCTSKTVYAKGTFERKPRVEDAGAYEIVVYPGVPRSRVTETRAALGKAHDEFVTKQGFLDPTQPKISVDGGAPEPNQPFVVLGTEWQPYGGCKGLATRKKQISLSPGCRGDDLRVTLAHELFHIIQETTLWKLDREGTKCSAGTLWWHEATAEAMGYRAMGAIGPLHGSTSNLSQRAESIVDRTLTTFVEGGTHQYDAYLFFDYAMKHHGFDMRAFWSTVSSDELAEAGAALSKYVGGGPDGLPYLAFVHAYATARSSASFDTLRSDWPAPPARAASDVPSNGDPLDLAQGENLAHLSSRTFKIAVPQTASTSKRLTVTLTGANVEAWLYKGTDATPFAKLKSGASGQSVGPHGGETIWLHVANTSLAAAGDGTFSLSVRTVDAPSFFWTYLDGIPQPMYSVQSTVISSTNTPNATNPAGTDSSSVTKVTASVTNDYVEVELTSGTITSETVFIPYSSKQTYSNVPGAIDWPTKLADVTGGYTQWQPGPGVPGSYSYLTRALVDIGYKALYDEWATKSKTHVASRLVPKADGFLSPVAANYLVPTGFGAPPPIQDGEVLVLFPVEYDFVDQDKLPAGRSSFPGDFVTYAYVGAGKRYKRLGAKYQYLGEVPVVGDVSTPIALASRSYGAGNVLVRRDDPSGGGFGAPGWVGSLQLAVRDLP